MRSALCVLTFAALSLPAGAANNVPETARLLEQVAARASKVKFEASEVAEYLRKRDANLAFIETRLEWMDQSAEEMRQLLGRLEASAPAATPDMEKLRQTVATVTANVDRQKELALGTGADKNRKTIRAKALEAAELSESIRELTTRLGN